MSQNDCPLTQGINCKRESNGKCMKKKDKKGMTIYIFKLLKKGFSNLPHFVQAHRNYIVL